ncbi:signal peptidase I [Euzebya pacifica]|uniref:signal peptidase I n=1 Tax=Euzebya pacifica TaxID=1608957 RepID=UPI0030F8B712
MTSSSRQPSRRESVRPADLTGRQREVATAGETDVDEQGPGLAMRALRSVREGVQLIVVALLMAFVLKSVAIQAFYIPSGSMLDTLQLQDRVLVEKLTYRVRPPERGEIIVFRRPGLEDDGFSITATATSFLEGLGLVEPDEDRDLIKRVIALPGETVEMIDGVVHINGTPLDEPYTRAESRDFPAVTVPGGHYYVLGDNRGNSLDSRFALGTIPEENVIGRAFVILWPPSNATLQMDQDYPNVGETPVPLGAGTSPSTTDGG